MTQCLNEVELATKLKVSDANTWCLWGMALLEKAKKTQVKNFNHCNAT